MRPFGRSRHDREQGLSFYTGCDLQLFDHIDRCVSIQARNKGRRLEHSQKLLDGKPAVKARRSVNGRVDALECCVGSPVFDEFASSSGGVPTLSSQPAKPASDVRPPTQAVRASQEKMTIARPLCRLSQNGQALIHAHGARTI